MSADENLPFAIGSTYYGTDQTIDTANLMGGHLIGKVVHLQDRYQGVDRSNRQRKMMICRNLSTITLLPKRLAHVLTGSGEFGGRTDGYTFAVAARWLGAVDEYLPAAGVRYGDLFWACIEGPATLQTPTVDNAGITYGDAVTAAAGTSATNADAGYIDKASFAGATTALAGQIRYQVGYALGAAIAGSHQANLLVDLTGWR